VISYRKLIHDLWLDDKYFTITEFLEEVSLIHTDLVKYDGYQSKITGQSVVIITDTVSIASTLQKK